MRELKTPPVHSVERALAILETVAESQTGRTLAEIARLLELPRSSAHCLLLTLQRFGYLWHQRETHRYRCSLKFLSLANMTPRGLELNDVGAPFLQTLMEQTRMTVHMALLERDEAILIRKVEPPSPPKLATWVGKRMVMNSTGVGKAILANLPERELSRLIEEHPLPRHNENTIVSAKKLKKQLCLATKLGYAIDDEEDEVGVRCIGSPVFDHTGRVIAAISLAGTTNQITEGTVSPLAEELKRTSVMISEQLSRVRSLFEA